MIERVLIVSLGSTGERHLRILRKRLPGAKVHVLRSGDREETESITTHLDVALDFSPQLAIIASPAPFHMETAAALVRSGCPVLIEKPIAAHSDGVGALLKYADARGVPVAVGYNMRFLSSLQRFRSLIHRGDVGRILSIRAEGGQYLPDWRPQKQWRETVSANANLGGGVLRELSHEIDYLRWIFGDISWVRAWLGYNGFNLDVEDTAHLTLGFQTHIENIMGPPPVAVLSIDFARRDRVRRCAVIGEMGTLIWDLVRGDIRRYDEKGESICYTNERLPDPDASYTIQLETFIGAILKHDPVAVSGRDGLAVLRVIEAAERSHLKHGKTQFVEQ